tara:strand:- start:662 stop:844 length:183 start_codon:yes stop_codon:yes gene_type:complete
MSPPAGGFNEEPTNLRFTGFAEVDQNPEAEDNKNIIQGLRMSVSKKKPMKRSKLESESKA